MRWLFNLTVVLSLLLMLSSMIGWMVSRSYTVAYTHFPLQIKIATGYLVIEESFTFVGSQNGFASEANTTGPHDIEHQAYGVLGSQSWSVAGVMYYVLPDFRTTGLNGYALFVPLWQGVILFSIPPLWWLIWFRKTSKRYRRKHGLCVKCGYDLRGSASASASCPECGATP